jgi:hypothetical protein
LDLQKGIWYKISMSYTGVIEEFLEEKSISEARDRTCALNFSILSTAPKDKMTASNTTELTLIFIPTFQNLLRVESYSPFDPDSNEITQTPTPNLRIHNQLPLFELISTRKLIKMTNK